MLQFTLSRYPTRRPTAATLASELRGLNLAASEEQIAIVRLKDANRFARLSVGDSFQGWILDSIEPSRITFRRGDVEEHIELTYDVPPPVQKPKRRKRRQRNQRNQDPAQVQPDTQQN